MSYHHDNCQDNDYQLQIQFHPGKKNKNKKISVQAQETLLIELT